MKPHVTKRKRTPGGELKVYKISKIKRRVRLCLECGKPIHGTKIQKNLPKTHRHPTRMYGSVLCVNCLEEKIKKQARGDNNA